MSSSDEEITIECTPPNHAMEELLPSKSRKIYETCYKQFMEWREKNNVNTFSENILLAYFSTLSETFKSSTLWKTYSMLRSMLIIKHNINIASYIKLRSLLKTKSYNYEATRSKALSLSAQDINTFINQAPDEIHLATKVHIKVTFCINKCLFCLNLWY